MKKQIIKNIFSLGTVQLVNYAFPLITVPYVSRIIGPDSYGIINYATAFIGYFAILIGYGFNLTATRRIAQRPNDNEYISKIFSEITSARIILFLVSSLLFIISVIFVKPLSRNVYVAIVLFASTISYVLNPQYIYQGKQNLTIFAFLNFAKGLINTILIFVLIKEKENYVVLPTLNVILAIFSSIFLLVYAVKKYRLHFYWVSVKKTLKLLITERIIFLSTVVISLYTTTNVVVLGFFASEAEVGFFTVSLSLLNVIISVISIPLSTALYPYIGTAFSVNKEKGLETIKKIFPIVSYTTFIACTILFIFAPIIIQLFYGDKFNNSIVAFRIIAFMPFVVSISNIFGIQTMLNLKMDKLFFKATASASVFGFLLNIIMSKMYSYIGTAWNTIVIEIFVTLYMYYLLKKNNLNVIERKYFNPKYSIMILKNAISKKGLER